MKSLLRKILLGDIEIKEYSTITIDGEISESVFLEAGEVMTNISNAHWVLCLEPVVFGIWLGRNKNPFDIDEGTKCTMYFRDSSGTEFAMAKRNAVAVITLDYFDKVEEAEGTLYLLKARETNVHHVNFLKTFILFNRYYKKPKYSFEKYKPLIASYSYPRKVRIISFKKDDYFNIFPMDLLGEIPQSDKYVFGLRHTNVTLAKIIEAERIVVSEVSYMYKDIIYELGRHHGGNPPTVDSLPFTTVQSGKFGFPVPEWACSYKEVKILGTKSLGSHMLLWGETLNENILKPAGGHLYHIHFLLYYHQKMRGINHPLV